MINTSSEVVPSVDVSMTKKASRQPSSRSNQVTGVSQNRDLKNSSFPVIRQNSFKQPTLNKQSEKLFLQKFTKQYTDILISVLGTDKIPAKISQDSFNKILKEFGSIKSLEPATDSKPNKELQMANDIWSFLVDVQTNIDGVRQLVSGESFSLQTAVGDIKVVLMAIY